MAVDSQPEMAAKSSVVVDARVFHVVLPGVVAVAADGAEEVVGGGEGFAEAPLVEEIVVAGDDLFVVGEVVASRRRIFCRSR